MSKAQFARRHGITANDVYILTGNSGPSEQAPRALSPSLGKLIARSLDIARIVF